MITIRNFLYKLKKKKYSTYFGNGDITIQGIVLNPVHVLPCNRWKYGQEIDFYMDGGLDIYFLRIINKNDCKITLLNDKGLRYILVSVPIDNSYNLRKIIYMLNKFPYNQKIHIKEKSYEFGEKVHEKGAGINRKR